MPHDKRQEYFLASISSPCLLFLYLSTFVHLSLPKGKDGRRALSMKKGRVCCLGLNWNYIKSEAIDRSSNGPCLDEKIVALSFSTWSQGPLQGTIAYPSSSFALSQVSMWTVVHGGLSGPWVKILCKSLYGIFAWFRACTVYCVAKGLEHENTDHCYW